LSAPKRLLQKYLQRISSSLYRKEGKKQEAIILLCCGGYCLQIEIFRKMKEKRFSYWHGSIAKRKLIIESWIERMRPKRQNRPEIALFSRLLKFSMDSQLLHIIHMTSA
jgi:hypothetical protein